jgi:hypothetical protein
MKIFKLLLFTFLLSSFTAFSQYYNNNGYNRYGLDRSIAGSDYSDRKDKPTPEEIEKMRSEQIDKYMLKLKDELTLDDLQFIAIKNEMISNSKNIDIVLKKENSQEEKTTEVKALMEKMNIRVKSYLNKVQKEKYDIFQEEMKNNKRDKKDKKSKKEDKPAEE